MEKSWRSFRHLYLWSGEEADNEGSSVQLGGCNQSPLPARRPILLAALLHPVLFQRTSVEVVTDVAGPTGLLHVHLDLDVMDPSAFPHVTLG